MSKSYSPLRYPGGKNKLSAFIANICVENGINRHYVEPYSGGASVALFLLFEGFVERITINDKDRSIYAFWHSVLHETSELCNLIERTEITVPEWKKQREIQRRKDDVSLLELGFSTFFLNRTNRSGIITGGIIGGLEQKGNYPIDCRFNKEDLIQRIQRIAERKNHINLYNIDAVDLINLVENEIDNTIFYFDPPYFLKGSSLYMNHYKEGDHLIVSEKIKNIANIKWIVSYDNQLEIKQLYDDCQCKEYSFKHTAYQSRIGSEILFFSQNIIQPQIPNYNPIFFRFQKDKIFYKEPTKNSCPAEIVP